MGLPTPRELAAQQQTGPSLETGPPHAGPGETPRAVPTLDQIAAVSREQATRFSPGLESRGLTKEDVESNTPPSQDAARGEPTSDPIRSTPQFLKAAHHLALMGMHTAEQLGQMEASEVLRLGAIAGERVRESSVLRQQAAENTKTGEGAPVSEGGDAVPDPELEARLRKTLEPVFESLGEAEGNRVLRAALSDAAEARHTLPSTQPALVTPDPIAYAEVERLAGVRAEIQAARAELSEIYPQLLSDATLQSVVQTADALGRSHRFSDVKSAIEAGAMALFGKAVVTQARGDVARVQEEAARRLATPSNPTGPRRTALNGQDTRTVDQKRWDYFNAVADNPGDPEAAMRKAGLK